MVTAAAFAAVSTQVSLFFDPFEEENCFVVGFEFKALFISL